MTSVIVAGSSLDYVADMNGRYASNVLRAAYVIGGQERASVNVRVNHNAEDCKSNSLVKGVAGGSAVGEFEGMVYVALDAQRTDAVQTSRNIEIGRGAHIVAKPQLEIYADDVKCSHGATVGQLDGEAVLYMRQRGLSLEQAKRLQIEGFVGDVVSQAGIFGEVLSQELASKLELL
jgi:Fe-S cluster assembly protein SufD